MYKKILLLFVISVSFQSVGQLTNKGDIKISSGTTLYIQGIDVVNDNGTSHTWSNDGQIIFKGDNFTNNGTMDDASTTGTTEFSGANEQNIKGSEVANFNELIVNNANNSVIQLENGVKAKSLNVSDGANDFDYIVKTDLSLTVANDVTANGDIRLSGTAQLIQTHTGTTSNSGSKYIWIDQQGTSNQYRYNYWSAPVNQDGTWKMRYLRDGAEGDDVLQSKYPVINIANNRNATNDINNAGGSHPVTLNSYWVYAFKNDTDGSYAGWYNNHIEHNGTVLPAEGYTMKGPGVDASLSAANGASTTDYLSWTFSGTPNDGDYTLTIDEGNDYLTGNPYPSALDANKFIEDNVSTANNGNNVDDIFNGTLYFWEHTDGDDHFGANYEGGYATYNLSGGVVAKSWRDGTTSVGTKEPKQYIPVGQGFLIWAETGQGGSVLFKNSQRAFKTEGTESVFIRPVAQTNIRLGFETPNNLHRQLLLAVRPNTTVRVDAGWDAPNFDGAPLSADAYWDIDGKDYIIEAIPEINVNSRIPLNVVMAQEGIIVFHLDEIENLPADITEVYVEDTQSQFTHRIDGTYNFKEFLQAGNYSGRFYLTFNTKGTNDITEVPLENVTAYYDDANHELIISNKENQEITSIKLFALTGQEVVSMNNTTTQNKIRIPANISKGIYLVNVTSTDRKVYSKKLIVR